MDPLHQAGLPKGAVGGEMLKRLRALATVGALAASLAGCGGNAGTDAQPPKPGTTTATSWCYAKDWLRSATGTYSYLYGQEDQTRATIDKSTSYSGWLMNSWHSAMDEGRLPEGIEPDLRAWGMTLQAVRAKGVQVSTFTAQTLARCQNDG